MAEAKSSFSAGPGVNLDEPSNKIWSIYVSESDRYDKALVESWKGDCDGQLIFAGLFSAVVTAFIIKSFDQLRVDSGDATIALLTHIAKRLDGVDIPVSDINTAPFQASAGVIWVNGLWIVSLILSVSSALVATLIQQWARDYFQGVIRQPIPHRRSRIRSMLWHGVDRFGLNAIVNFVPLLLQISVFLFLIGLVVYLQPLSMSLSITSLTFTAVALFIYISLTALPIVSIDCPYRTPLSAVLWSTLYSMFRYKAKIPAFRDFFPSETQLPTQQNHKDAESAAEEESASKLSENPFIDVDMWRSRDKFAMSDRPQRSLQDFIALKWTVETLTDDDELEPFVEGMPGFLNSSEVTDAADVLRALLYGGLGLRIVHLLRTCLKEDLLTQDRRIQRATTCLTAIRSITLADTQGRSKRDDTQGRGERDDMPWSWTMCFGPRAASFIRSLQMDSSDTIACHAICTSAAIASHLINELVFPEIAVPIWYAREQGKTKQGDDSIMVANYLKTNIKAFSDLVIFQSAYNKLPAEHLEERYKIMMGYVKRQYPSARILSFQSDEEQQRSIQQFVTNMRYNNDGVVRNYDNEKRLTINQTVRAAHLSMLRVWLKLILRRDFTKEHELISATFRSIAKPIPFQRDLKKDDKIGLKMTQKLIRILLKPIVRPLAATKQLSPLPSNSMDSIFRVLNDYCDSDAARRLIFKLKSYRDSVPPGANVEVAESVLAIVETFKLPEASSTIQTGLIESDHPEDSDEDDDAA